MGPEWAFIPGGGGSTCFFARGQLVKRAGRGEVEVESERV